MYNYKECVADKNTILTVFYGHFMKSDNYLKKYVICHKLIPLYFAFPKTNCERRKNFKNRAI